MSIKEYIAAIEKTLSENEDPKRAPGAKSYMRDQFEFYGMPAAKRRELERQFIRENGTPPVEDLPKVIAMLWKKEQREFQYFGMEMMEKMKKQLNEDCISILEFMITTKSWWDTVDLIAGKTVGYYFLKFPERRDKKIKEWMNSDNLWLQRTCILFQLNYKEKTDEKLLFALCKKLSQHPDFFIRKAIGWSLRQYARTRPDAVRKFVSENDLSGLSRKEALKHL